MSATTARRGRPKGSGIDDSTILREIAGMLTADPELKPTTAIRNLGITDPSVIRRLRDKFTAFRHECSADLEMPLATAAKRLLADNDDIGSRTICLETARDPKRRQPPASEKAERTLQPSPPTEPVVHGEMAAPIETPAPAPSRSPRPASEGTVGLHSRPPDPVNDAARIWSALLTAGLRATSAAFKAQVELGSRAALSPPAVAALRFQLAWNAYFISLVGPQLGEARK